VNGILAAAVAAGELICEFGDGYRKVLLFNLLDPENARVLASDKPGRRPVLVRGGGSFLHFVQPEGASVRVTTLTFCTRVALRRGEEVCTRFAAQHAWHFDTAARIEADASFRRQPAGAANGACEPWRID
jgi:hypothetical protein